MLLTASALFTRGVFSRGEPERPSKVWRPRSGLPPHAGGQRAAPLVARPQEQPLLPGPGKNENKMLGRVQKTSRWSAERRGVGSLRRRALASKESESPRAVMHALRMYAASGRLSALRPPRVGWGMEERKRR